MQLETKDGLIPRRHLAKGSAIGSPVAGRAGHQIELHHRDGDTVDHALPILGQVQQLENHPADQVEGLQQVSPAPIEATLGRNNRKQCPLFAPITEHFSFDHPAATFTHQDQGE